MESTVAALLLVTSTVILSCICIVYAVDTVTQSINGDSPQMQLINNIQNRILNNTSFFNGTYPVVSGTPTPTATPTP